ncbi:MAG: cytochrome c oxidase subunit II [Acidobacteriota bacterium]
MWKNFPLFPDKATELARQVDALYFTALGISAFFTLLIAVLILYFAVRYRRRSHDEVGQPEKAGMWLEITWSVIPLIILMGMFVWGTKVYIDAYRPPADAVEYFVTGKQWMWKFQHPEGQREINHLHVPLGKPVRLTMTSEDVIHSFFVPAFRVKADVLPGRYTQLWFKPEKPGTYTLYCAESFGAEHSRMIGSVTVMEPGDYEAWLSGEAKGPTPIASGEELFQAKACNTCHRPDSAAQAPILHGIFGKSVETADGESVLFDEEYIRESILKPFAKIVKGYQPLMPTYQGQLSEEEILQLITYIKSLSEEETEEQSAQANAELRVSQETSP